MPEISRNQTFSVAMIVKKAEYIGQNKIKLLFSNGITKVVDFTPFLASPRKIIKPLLDIDYLNNSTLMKSQYVDLTDWILHLNYYTKLETI